MRIENLIPYPCHLTHKHIMCATHMKKNLTLSIEDDLLQRARVLAAMRRTSVNDMIRGFLETEVGTEAHDARKTEWDAFFKRVDKASSDDMKALPAGLPSREDMYDEVLRERGLL